MSLATDHLSIRQMLLFLHKLGAFSDTRYLDILDAVNIAYIKRITSEYG